MEESMKRASSLLGCVIVVCASVVVVRTQPKADLAATPQGKLVLAYYKAAHAGDVAGLKACVTAESAKDLDGPHGKDMIAMLKEMTPAVTPKVTKVNVTGKAAAVDVEVKEGATTTTDHLKLVLVDTAWKIDMHAK
jgi:hypothetical protein